MTMARPHLLLALTVLVIHAHDTVIAQNNVSDSIANLSISGWWSDCDFSAEISCAGTFQEYEPTPLDPSGNTCYLNAHVDSMSTTRNVVFWLGPPGSEEVGMKDTDVFLYTLRVDDTSLLATNCTESGACSCESIDSLRDPWRTTGMCSGDCIATPAEDLLLLNDDECAVLYKESDINPFFNDTIVTCTIQGTLIDTSPTSPSESPSMEEPTSGAGLLTSLWSWMVLVFVGLHTSVAEL